MGPKLWAPQLGWSHVSIASQPPVCGHPRHLTQIGPWGWQQPLVPLIAAWEIRELAAKQIQRSRVTNFFSFFCSYIYIFFSFLFGKALEMFLKGLFSATSFLLHHSEHCNIIKLVKRKQWCLSFSQTARCSFRGETASARLGEDRIPLPFFKQSFYFQNHRKKKPRSLPKILLQSKCAGFECVGSAAWRLARVSRPGASCVGSSPRGWGQGRKTAGLRDPAAACTQARNGQEIFAK